jgi:hypothetical protein
MAREFIQKKFFDHNPFANTYYASLMPLEYFIANVLMRGDLQRIVWASDDMAFYRRLLTVGTQNGADTSNIKPANLELPFANYWYNGGWTPDDRIHSIQPAQMINGTWHEGLPAYLRAMAVKGEFSFTAFYSRDDDARLAYDLLLWEQNPKGPAQFATHLQWQDIQLAIPTFFTIEEPAFNPDFQESEWLKAQRIFPIKFKITLRTYSIHMRAQESFDGINRETATYATGLPSSRLGGNMYLTEEAILNFAAAKGWGELGDTTSSLDLDIADPFTEKERTTLIADPRDITTDLVTGYFENSNDVEVNYCRIQLGSVTQNAFTLEWQIKPSDRARFSHMKMLIPGQAPVWIRDVNQTSYIMAGLYPNSDYHIIVLFYAISGTVTDVHLQVQTLEDPSDPIKRPLRRKMGQLRGMEW